MISGFHLENADGSTTLVNCRLELFRNVFDEQGNQYPRPRTLLNNSEQLESGEALDMNFRDMAAGEIAQFRREIVERTGYLRRADKITDQDLLREVTNTVGKKGRLGDSIGCAVSVSMLTEGWDANTVSYEHEVRAFGTQFLCEQVVGRALRRQCYDFNEDGLFDVEYADDLGIPFDFTAKPVVTPAKPLSVLKPLPVTAVRPERDALEIRFPRVAGYRVELPEERLEAAFNEDSVLDLTPDWVVPFENVEPRHYRRGRGSQLGPRPMNCGPRSPSVQSDPAPALHQVPRPGGGAKARTLRAAQADHQAVARRLSRLQGGHLSCPGHVPGAGRHGLRAHRRGHHPGRNRPSPGEDGARSLQSRRCPPPT